MTSSRPGDPLLEVADVTVRFGGLVANDAVELTLAEGEIAALIGPNGAGKTTLFNVITGAQPPTAGHVRFAAEDITDLDRRARANLGIARTFQNLSLVDSLSALDNVTVGLGRFRRNGLLAAVLGLPSSRQLDRRIRELASEALRFVDLADRAAARTGDLPYGDRRRLELARALAMGPRLLLLDEPSAGMGPAETASLVRTIRRSRDELGVTVLVVEHDMSFVRTLAERTSVLDFGRVIASGATSAVLNDARVAEAYLGKRESSRA
jgi:ABC-type branched-subunit amino acid transport system ATPase component